MRDMDSLILENLYAGILLKESSDEEYMHLAENPEENKEELQRMVYEAAKSATPKNHTLLFRGLEKPFDKLYDNNRRDSPQGYSTWTDSIALAREYAGKDGFLYVIQIPNKEIKREYINNDGDRAFVYSTGKPAGLHGVSGNEYLLYEYHDSFTHDQIKSADPITHDDEGNIIPLSQRFDSSSDDIRY